MITGNQTFGKHVVLENMKILYIEQNSLRILYKLSIIHRGFIIMET